MDDRSGEARTRKLGVHLHFDRLHVGRKAPVRLRALPRLAPQRSAWEGADRPVGVPGHQGERRHAGDCEDQTDRHATPHA